ncbi:MAG: TatD family hydrolase [Candidatus Woesearchaeota archaeon]
MMLIDCHNHIDSKQFHKDIDKVLERAKKAGVKAIINNGLLPESNRKTLELASKHDVIKAALGLYPVDVLNLKMSDKDIDDEIDFIQKNKDKIVAVGEIGLDFYWVKEDYKRQRQKELFQKMIDLAIEIKKPIIVHSRKAEKETIEIIEKSGIKKVMMHCFCGTIELVKRIEKNGWYLSIPCTVVRSAHFQQVVKEVNINKLLTETDGPYLSPFPRKRNEPANIAVSVKKIAEIKNMDEEETGKNIFMNFQHLFL